MTGRPFVAASKKRGAHRRGGHMRQRGGGVAGGGPPPPPGAGVDVPHDHTHDPRRASVVGHARFGLGFAVASLTTLFFSLAGLPTRVLAVARGVEQGGGSRGVIGGGGGGGGVGGEAAPSRLAEKTFIYQQQMLRDRDLTTTCSIFFHVTRCTSIRTTLVDPRGEES